MDPSHKKDPEVVAIIPARYHSNRFEGKPLAMIMGKPMIQHVYERATAVDLISMVAVATDAVGEKVLLYVAEVCALAGCLAGAGHAALAVGDDRCVVGDQSALQERQDR